MLEMTRHQEAAQERIALEYGAARVDPIAGSTDVLIVGLDDERPTGFHRVAADGSEDGDPPVPFCESYILIVDGACHTAGYKTLEALADEWVRQLQEKTPDKVRVRAKTGKGQAERELTPIETERLLALATERALACGARA